MHHDGAPAAGIWVALVDADPELDDLLGVGVTGADGAFRLSFTSEAFNQEPGEDEALPDLYAVLSVAGDKGPVPVARRALHGLSFERAEHLGSLTLPAQPAAGKPAARRLSAMPGSGKAARRLRLDAEIVAHASAEIAPLVEAVTGWSGLLQGIQFEIDEEMADGVRRYASALLGREISAEEWPQVETAYVAIWDPVGARVFLNRKLLEAQNLDYLKVAIGHELVHVGQTRNHPAMDAEFRRMATGALTLLLSGSNARSSAEEWSFMANIEGFATYIEEHYLRRVYTHASALPDIAAMATSRFEYRRGKRRVDRAVADLASEGSASPAGPARHWGTTASQYTAGCAHYLSLHQDGRPARFDPAARPPPAMDAARARYLVRRAEDGCTTSQFGLGALLLTGEAGVPADRDAATRWLTMAAEAGHPKAALVLASILPVQDAERVRWLRIAAAQGEAAAMSELGKAHLLGSGIPVDMAAGFEWAKRAAEAGSLESMDLLAKLFTEGLGVAQDIISARLWKRRAERVRSAAAS